MNRSVLIDFLNWADQLQETLYDDPQLCQAFVAAMMDVQEGTADEDDYEVLLRAFSAATCWSVEHLRAVIEEAERRGFTWRD